MLDDFDSLGQIIDESDNDGLREYDLNEEEGSSWSELEDINILDFSTEVRDIISILSFFRLMIIVFYSRDDRLQTAL